MKKLDKRQAFHTRGNVNVQQIYGHMLDIF